MPLTIIRPTINDEKRTEVKGYLLTQWKRSKDGRSEQVDSDYDRWSRAYDGTPAEEVRSVPFYKASNFVVKLIRIYLDTFVARTLNIIFATKPLYVAEGLPTDLRDSFELYLNKKANYDWNHYWMARELCFRGNKNGTVVFKQPWVEQFGIDIMPSANSPEGFSENRFPIFRGPKAIPIPFEDFYIYPVTANLLEDSVIKFHRTRYVKEIAQQKVDKSEWQLPEGKTIETYLAHPSDTKRASQQGDAGVTDPYLEEVSIIEVYFQWNITNDASKYYDIVVHFEEKTGDVFDLYFNPYPRNACIFRDYRPFPKEDFYYGESLCQILGQSQEEASRIHNERRDNSTIASSVIFKRKNGSLIPNPSTNWYPGKVFDLADMDDLDVVNVGRNYDDMIQQEDYTFQYANKLSGCGDVMQGDVSGSMGKRGIYNTGGTIALMSEGNQRQDTNIRDVRESVSGIALDGSRLQAYYGSDDPLLDTLPPDAVEKAKAALKWLASDKSRYVRLEVKTSNAGANAEVRKTNLLQMSQVLGQYGQTVLGMSQQVMSPGINPVLRSIMMDVISMQKSLAQSLVKAFDEWPLLETMPDVQRSISSAPQPGGAAPGPQAPAAQACPLSLDQLLRLKQAFHQDFWGLLQIYLDLGRQVLDNSLRNSKTNWDATCFMRGQYHTYNAIKRLPEEIDYLIEAKKQEAEMEKETT